MGTYSIYKDESHLLPLRRRFAKTRDILQPGSLYEVHKLKEKCYLSSVKIAGLCTRLRDGVIRDSVKAGCRAAVYYAAIESLVRACVKLCYAFEEDSWGFVC